MLYAIVFVVIILVIIVLYVVRKAHYAYRKRQLARSTLPTTTSDLNSSDPTDMSQITNTRDPGPPVTFRGVARSVTNSVFPQPAPPRESLDEYRPFHDRYRQSVTSEMSGSQGGRVYSSRGAGVERAADSDPDLPTYGDNRGTLPLRPEPVYNPSAARPNHDTTIATTSDAPPKYAQSPEIPPVNRTDIR